MRHETRVIAVVGLLSSSFIIPHFSFAAMPAAAGIATDGFTARFDIDLNNVTKDEHLYEYGALKVDLRMTGVNPAMSAFDDKFGNYLSYPMPDGKCPILEAMVAGWSGRLGVPLALFAKTGGVHRLTVCYDTVHVRMFVGDQTDDDMPNLKYVVWPSNLTEKVLSPRVRMAKVVTPMEKTSIPPEPDETPIAGSPQFWTPPAFNAWVGDVSVGVWKGRFHVFYLYDRRHHGSGGGNGRHYFAHLSSPDLVHWVEHPLVTPIEHWWECQGTGTPFEYEGKYCLAYGLHTERLSRTNHIDAFSAALPPEKRGEGNFMFAYQPDALPDGGTYAESTDGIHFRKSGRYISMGANPTIYNRPDGRLGIATGGGQFCYSRDGKIGHWVSDGTPAPANGDCPAPFSWCGRDYIMAGFYLMASRGADGVWTNMAEAGDDIYDGTAVPMVASWGDDRRILVGWFQHQFGWGGFLVFRELVRFPDGTLGIKWLKETPPPGDVREFRVTDLSAPFVLRAHGEKGEDVEFRIDPAEGRAQVAFPAPGQAAPRKQTAAEIITSYPEKKRFSLRNEKGDLAYKGKGFAIGHVRGLDKPFTVRVAQYYDAKSRSTIFDMELAGTRTLLAHRAGRFTPIARK